MTTDSKKHDTTTVEQTQEEKKAAFLKKAACPAQKLKAEQRTTGLLTSVSPTCCNAM